MEISNPREIRIEDYNYNLPDDRIAKYPLTKRDSSKLLVYKDGEISDFVFSDLPEYLSGDSLLVFNNTKVIQARLHFWKATGAQIEIFCLEPHSPHDYQLNFQQTERCSWICLIGNLKKWKEGNLTREISIDGKLILVTAKRLQSHGDAHIIEFEWNNADVTFSELLEVMGELPIPPYLNRDTEEQDKQTYQTVYSKIDGSVAAPTAGLHFTPQVFNSLEEKGIKTAEITLHVGAGTFRPVKSEQIKDHLMHSEFISVKREFFEQLLNHKGRVITVGTTSVRTLESLYYLGELLEKEENPVMQVSQWQPYEEASNQITKEKALTNLIDYLDVHKLNTLIADTQIIIAPGYKFKIVDGIVTNFHQPQSTLLLLVSAFLGENKWEDVYKHALENDYRFLSYGDSSLLLNE
ncbi:S-adenosylmethionine:tRNA ribosyltransferase-isomerase [Dysgonomonas hofstadii]|uniref:S-adenosylmethionine:tRNA ribosyltransferase-isomerase n=1 Tax=Dysgonomonas hofstadii TaxID=637886 RepID=A0A840CQC6_9BACT|nr:S-adenosylmethionine:tRNA ribosyltransferase-isomerase [Dysgonomonas hofstadii]MBB4036298.1 S-adenosylmethionine:tRNA ribosyltransferase-isomerase [Dysgonomonas hofstadii]